MAHELIRATGSLAGLFHAIERGAIAGKWRDW